MTDSFNIRCEARIQRIDNYDHARDKDVADLEKLVPISPTIGIIVLVILLFAVLLLALLLLLLVLFVVLCHFVVLPQDLVVATSLILPDIPFSQASSAGVQALANTTPPSSSSSRSLDFLAISSSPTQDLAIPHLSCPSRRYRKYLLMKPRDL
ncbi:hypothetical protein BKA93DRAFT_826570 [Sparassis latifolia]